MEIDTYSDGKNRRYENKGSVTNVYVDESYPQLQDKKTVDKCFQITLPTCRTIATSSIYVDIIFLVTVHFRRHRYIYFYFNNFGVVLATGH